MAYQVTKNVAYDNAVTLARWQVALAVSTAGSGGTFGKYTARGNETLYSMGAFQVVAGTSTYTTTDTGSPTATGAAVTTNTTTAATLIQYFRVSGTSTTTFPTFVVSTQGSKQNNFTAPAGGGGVALTAGDLIYATNGTDTSATSIPVLEFGYTQVTGQITA